MRLSGRSILPAAAGVWMSLGCAVASAEVPAGGEVTVLATQSNWRCFAVWKTELARLTEGGLVPVSGNFKHLGGRSLGFARREKPTEAIVSRSDLPPADWMQPTFDDGAWPRSKGPLVGGRGRSLALLCLRATFRVTDPAKAAGLRLSLAYRGGARVFLNGREIARGHLPKGEIEMDAPAEDYANEAYVDPDGYVLRRGFGDPQKYKDRFALRIRRLADVAVPADLLVKGRNVLAVALHRAPTAEVLLTGAPRRWTKGYCWWSMLGLNDLQLTAPAGAAVVANTGRPRAVQVWTAPSTLAVYSQDFGPVGEAIEPIRLLGARNGSFSGVAVVGSSGPVAGLRVRTGDLRQGEAVIPASAVQVRYARADLQREGVAGGRYPRHARRFDGLLEHAPAEVSVPENADGVTQPIWLTVRVPREATAGDYEGAATVSADGLPPTRLPIHLTVRDFALPDPKAFVTHVGLIQSPDTLALKYNVPMWSDRHWALIDRSFEHIAQVGGKVVVIPLIRRTHVGNEHSMVRWLKKGSTFTHDFSIVEKYLDVALKHLGTSPVIVAYTWEYYTGGNSFGKRGRQGTGMKYTILDPETAKLTEAEGPHWNDPGIVAFWKPVFDGLYKVLEARGVADSLVVGISGDRRPNKDTLDALNAAAPKARWMSCSHGYVASMAGKPIGYMTYVWGCRPAPDPSAGRRYGWKNPLLVTTFPRAGSGTVGAVRPSSPALHYRMAIEGMQAAGIHGMGRVGADFWPVVKDRRGRTADLLGRYGESGWAQLNVRNAFPAILSPGPDGALGTARFEMLREGVQEAETRIVIERALLDPARRAKLGDDLAARAQDLLDRRTRDILRAKQGSDVAWLWYASLVRSRSERLYMRAAEVSAALGE